MKSFFATIFLSAVAATSAIAQSQGDWTLGLGLGLVAPKSDSGTLAGGEADVDDNVRPTITAEYFIRDNLGIELLASWQFKHDVDIDGIGDAGSVKHFPPTLSLNYHFPTQSSFKPYVGIGINYTVFSDEDSDLGDLELDDSVGIAVQAGLDYMLDNGAALRANIRWADIDTDVDLNGTFIGEAEIDPIIVTLGYVWQF